MRVFPLGEVNPFGGFFIGKSYLNMLTRSEPVIAQVTFEPGCRNNWHVHRSASGGGQILLCLSGKGWYQEWEKLARPLGAGDVVVIPAGVKHWHGAARTSWFCHLAIEVPGTETSTQWLEPVDEKQYSNVKG